MTIPGAVAREVAGIHLPDWIAVESWDRPFAPAILDAHLDAGDTEVLALALDRGGRVILDELAARNIARRLGVPVIGTLGILLAAKRKGRIGSIRGPIDALREGGFRVSPTLYEAVLREAEELP